MPPSGIPVKIGFVAPSLPLRQRRGDDPVVGGGGDVEVQRRVLGVRRRDGHAEQPALALRRGLADGADLGDRVVGRGQQQHARGVALGDHGVAVGQEADAPRHLEAGGDGADHLGRGTGGLGGGRRGGRRGGEGSRRTRRSPSPRRRPARSPRRAGGRRGRAAAARIRPAGRGTRAAARARRPGCSIWRKCDPSSSTYVASGIRSAAVAMSRAPASRSQRPATKAVGTRILDSETRPCSEVAMREVHVPLDRRGQELAHRVRGALGVRDGEHEAAVAERRDRLGPDRQPAADRGDRPAGQPEPAREVDGERAGRPGAAAAAARASSRTCHRGRRPRRTAR